MFLVTAEPIQTGLIRFLKKKNTELFLETAVTGHVAKACPEEEILTKITPATKVPHHRTKGLDMNGT